MSLGAYWMFATFYKLRYTCPSSFSLPNSEMMLRADLQLHPWWCNGLHFPLKFHVHIYTPWIFIWTGGGDHQCFPNKTYNTLNSPLGWRKLGFLNWCQQDSTPAPFRNPRSKPVGPHHFQMRGAVRVNYRSHHAPLPRSRQVSTETEKSSPSPTCYFVSKHRPHFPLRQQPKTKSRDPGPASPAEVKSGPRRAMAGQGAAGPTLLPGSRKPAARDGT